jgi:hypothetical protein
MPPQRIIWGRQLDGKPFPTIWEVSDDLWQRIHPSREEFWPAKATGRHHADW